MGRKSKVVRPTVAEQKIITKRLKKKYSQMYGLVGSARERKLYKNLSANDKKAIESMVTLKLKAIYGGKKKKPLGIHRIK